MRLASAFGFQLGHPVEPGLITVGKYDGKHASLACATTSGKVLIHNPHEFAADAQATAASSSASSNSHIRFLNINKKITALKAGYLSAAAGENDLLLIGTQTNLMAYDVGRNHDVFYKDVNDGVGAISVGKAAQSEEPLVFVGGNCSIQGYDRAGREAFWTVTGDNVAALALCDVDNDGVPELMAGSADFEVRAFKQEEGILEITEADRVTHLCAVGGGGSGGKPATRWACGLANGTVGLYERGKRLWRVRTKHGVAALAAFDIDGDGEEELVCGLDNGSLVARKIATGAVVYKDNFPAAIAGIARADYRGIGREELIVVATDGEVRGYEPRALPSDEVAAGRGIGAAPPAAGSGRVASSRAEDVKAVEALQRRKQELVMELRSLEEAARVRKAGGRPPGTISANTKLSVRVVADPANRTLELLLSTNSDAAISAAVAVDPEGRLFGGETLVTSATSAAQQLGLRLPLEKHQAGLLKIQAFVGPRGSPAGLYVLEADHAVPKFAGFVVANRESSSTHDSAAAAALEPLGCVSFSVPEQQSRVAMWVGQSFTRQEGALEISGAATANDASWRFLSVTPGSGGVPSPLWIECHRGSGTAVRVRCNDLGLAGEIVQDLCKFLQVHELESAADFPEEMAQFEATLQCVTDYDSLRLRLAADTADYSQRVKVLVVRAEDCRLLGDYPLMRRAYAELMAINRQLMSEHAKRATNQAALLASLKEVNAMIQKAASLRMGKAKTRVVAECRTAVKDRNTAALLHIAAKGSDPHARVKGGDDGLISGT